MGRRIPRALLAVAVAGLVAGGAALAQDGGEKSRFVRLLEGLVSTPDRQVSLSGLDGVFSSHPTIERITVADSRGAWMTIDAVEMRWNRAALFRRTLDIASLTAERVNVLRKPVADAEADPDGGSGLPVEIAVDSFRLDEIALAGPVLGAGVRLRAEGSAEFREAASAAHLAVERLDKAGTLVADLRLVPAKNVLDADLRLAEPAGGLVATLLDLRDRPAVAVTLAGAGPLDSWRAELAIEAAGVRVLSGGLGVSRAEDSYRLSADLVGALEPVAPAAYAALVKGESRLAFNIVRGDDGAIAVQSASLRSQGVDLAGSGALTPDLVPQRADLSLKLGQAGRTVLPFVPGAVSVAGLSATASLDGGAVAPWRAEIAADGVESEFGRAGGVAFTATGQASDLADPRSRSTTFRIEGSADSLAAADPAQARALGSSLRLSGDGAWAAGKPLTVEALQLVLDGASANVSGAIDTAGFQGKIAASATDLARYAGLAGRPISGSARIEADGSVAFDPAGFDLKLAGEAGDLGIGIPALDPLLAGTTRLQGGLARSGDGIRFDALSLANKLIEAELDGSFADPQLDLSLTATVADLSAATPRAAGRARISARVTGTGDAPRVTAEASGEDVMLMGRALSDASARFSGIVAGPETGGEAELSGSLGGVPVRGAARLAAGADGARAIDDLLVTVGESRAAGDLTIGADGLIAGRLAIVSPDLSKVAPLFLVEARGMVKADVTLAGRDGEQSASLTASATDLVYEGVSIDSADLSGEAENIFAAPRIDGRFAIRDLKSGGLVVVSAGGTAARQGQSTAISAEAQLADGRARLSGILEPRGQGLRVAVQEFAFARTGIEVSLAAPTSLAVEGGAVRLEPTTLKAGGGRVQLAGLAGKTLDLTVRLEAVPASLVNALSPDFGAEGSISGTASITGAAASPNGRFDAVWSGASVLAARNAGLAPLTVTAQGGLGDGVVNLASRIAGGDGLAIQAAGTIGTTGASPLDLKITGAVPLSLGNAQLASRGSALQGALDLDLAIGGTAASPRFSGRVTADGGGLVDPETGIVLTDLSLAAAVSGNRLVIERLTAKSGEGTISAGGAIGLSGGFPVDLTAQIRQARYVNGTLVSARFDADLTVTGSLAEGPVLGGTVFLDRTEVTVPEQLPQGSVAVDVEHRNESAAVDETLARAKNRPGGGKGPAGSGGIRLDLTIEAPQQIFVRGRGLDAELGGRLRVTGRTSALVADGGFKMNRGRLDIFTQRITFNRGEVTFAGDLDPELDFAGTTQSGEIAVTVTVAGQASDPEVTFSSVPELPQDEVLAHLIFERGIGELSPLQIARLAEAAAQLSGATGGGGLLDKLRASTGLDDLDIVTDDEGTPAVAAGRYVSENVYIGVQQGASAESSRVTIDLDITDDVKARAGVTPQGNSSLGVFYEKEY